MILWSKTAVSVNWGFILHSLNIAIVTELHTLNKDAIHDCYRVGAVANISLPSNMYRLYTCICICTGCGYVYDMYLHKDKYMSYGQYFW